jgi:hypothetical protein
MELDALPPGKAARSARIATCRFCKFSAYYSPQIWHSMLERISRTGKVDTE